MSSSNDHNAPSLDGTFVNGNGNNGKMLTPPNEEDLHRYVTDDAPRVRKDQVPVIRGSGSTTNAAGLIVRYSNPFSLTIW